MMALPTRSPMLRAAATVAGVLLGCAAGVGPAAAIELAQPIACTINKDCWLVQYVDVDPSPERLDYMCGWLSYDKSNGTDFGLRDLQVMRDGVNVLAAADGTVIGRRDGEPDVSVADTGKERVEGKECGNGVRLDHGGGWTTQYCHLRRGSIAVRVGEPVRTGQKLGLVGLSGQTEFPHLDFSVRYNEKIVDPFVGLERTARCGLGPQPLWRADVARSLSYRAAILHNAGFTDNPKPSAEAAREGQLRTETLSTEAAALILWIDLYWARPDDALHFSITGPDGKSVLDYRAKVSRRVARDFYHAGKRRPAGGWAPGTYRGEVRLVREQGPIGREEYRVTETVIVR